MAVERPKIAFGQRLRHIWVYLRVPCWVPMTKAAPSKEGIPKKGPECRELSNTNAYSRRFKPPLKTSLDVDFFCSIHEAAFLEGAGCQNPKGTRGGPHVEDSLASCPSTMRTSSHAHMCV